MKDLGLEGSLSSVRWGGEQLGLSPIVSPWYNLTPWSLRMSVPSLTR